MAVLGSNSLNHSADLLIQRAGTTRITVTSTGLTLGGNVILGNAGTATNHAVRADRTISTGSGLSGGGNLTANRTFSVDGTVVRTTGNQTIGGIKTFNGLIEASGSAGGMSVNNAGSRKLEVVSAGSGHAAYMTFHRPGAYAVRFGLDTNNQLRVGGWSLGNIAYTLLHQNNVNSFAVGLSGNQTIGGTKTFSAAVVLSTAGTATSHAVRADRTISTGSGINGGGNLTANRTFSVDGTVVRTTGNQTIGGTKTFSGTIRSSIGGQGKSINVNGVVESNGYVGRAGVNGGTGNTFNIQWTGSAARLWIDTSLIGTIQISSDYRIKKDIQSIEDNAISRIMQLRPVSYKNAEYGDIFKEDPEQTIHEGFIAHELAEVIPSAVDGEKDAPNQIQSLRLDSLLAVLTKGIQEQQLIIQELKSDLDQIKSSL